MGFLFGQFVVAEMGQGRRARAAMDADEPHPEVKSISDDALNGV